MAAALIGAGSLLPSDSATGWSVYIVVVLGSLGLAAVAAGRAAPGDRWLPGLLAGALGAYAAGDAWWFAATWTGHDATASPADLGYLLSYALLATALLGVLGILGPRREPDRGRRLDVVLDVITLATLAAVGLDAGGALDAPRSSAAAEAILTLYPLLDAVLLGLVLRVLVGTGRDQRRLVPLALGVGCWLVGDVAYLALPGVADRQTVDALWMVGCVGIAFASVQVAHHPGSARVPARPEISTGVRLLTALPPLAVPPALVIVVATGDGGGLAGLHLLQVSVAAGVLVTVGVLRYWRTLLLERSARREAEAALQVRTDFLATMSHELRTPLHGVLGLTEMLLTGPLEEEQRAYAERTRTSGARLLDLLEDLLDVAEEQPGPEAAPFDPVAMVREVVERHADVAAARGLDLTVCTSAVPPGTRVVSDARRWRQILRHLLENALRFTETGGVLVRLQLLVGLGDDTDPDQPSGTPGWVLRLEVSDTGPGVDPAALAHLAAPFTQARQGADRPHDGAGLGLAVVHRFLTDLDGRLDVRSGEHGAGSVFRAEAPVVVLAAPVDDVPAPEPVAPTPPLVLVVDDDEVNRLVALGMLRRLGVRASAVDGGAQALEALARTPEGPIAAVLLDLHMPDVDGYDVVREHRRREQALGLPPVPMLAMTASTGAQERARAEEAGLIPFLAKPVGLGALAAALTEVGVAVAPPPAPRAD